MDSEFKTERPPIMDSNLVERVAEAIGKAPYPPQLHVMGAAHKHDMARAAVAMLLDEVYSNLLAVQFNPAPYTAMRHRLAMLRKDALGDEPVGIV